MKSTILAGIWVCVCILAGCGGTPEKNTLMEGASPDTSAMVLYVYDGEQVTQEFLFDAAAEQEILDAISSVRAEEAAGWSPEQITFPVYGLEIGSKDGWGIQVAWSDGYLMTKEGNVYRFAYDIPLLEKDYDWTDRKVYQDSSMFPCARALCLYHGAWVLKMLSPAGELTPPEGITMELTGKTEEALTVELSNNGREEWTYGEGFALHVQLDGIWYNVPVTPENWAFTAIGLLLPAGETKEETYALARYGELPAGTYRLAVEGMVTEFEVERR